MQAGVRLPKEILVRMSRDKARNLLRRYDLPLSGALRGLVIESIREVIAGFRMPLAGTIKGTGGGRS